MAKTPKAPKTLAKRRIVKFSVVNELHLRVLQMAQVNGKGEIRLKRTEFKQAVLDIFEQGAKKAAQGERVRFPVLGALVRKEVKARKAGKGTNPFTGEPMTIKARPQSKKPRWSFSRGVKETFANKKNW